jgi:hypothetical protein
MTPRTMRTQICGERGRARRGRDTDARAAAAGFSRSEKERRRYDRCYRRLAEIAPELRTLGRNIALRLILRAAVARLW